MTKKRTKPTTQPPKPQPLSLIIPTVLLISSTLSTLLNQKSLSCTPKRMITYTKDIIFQPLILCDSSPSPPTPNNIFKTDITLTQNNEDIALLSSYTFTNSTSNFKMRSSLKRLVTIEIISETKFKFSEISYNTNSVTFSEEILVLAKMNSRSLYIYYVYDLMAYFYIGARRLADPSQYCIVLYHQRTTTSTNIIDVPYQIESMINIKNPQIQEIVTVGLDSRRMIFHRSSSTIIRTEESYAQENSVITGLDKTKGIAASKNSHKISKFDLNTLTNIEVTSLDLIEVQPVNLIRINGTEYFIVHDPEASSFLVGQESPILQFIHLEPLEGGIPVPQILTLPFSRVVLAVNQENSSIDFYKIHKMKCHLSCNSDACKTTNFVNDKCDKCFVEYQTFKAFNSLGNPVCTACYPHCQECHNDGGPCYKCINSSLSVLKDKCTNCHSHCQTCSRFNTGWCSTCKPAFRFHKGYCLNCDSKCSTCDQNDKDICLECQPGFSLSNTKCYLCETNCETCTGSGADKCVKCSLGYQLEGGNCLACHSSCQECIGASHTHCTACSTPQFELRKGECFDTTLFTCVDGCQVCTGPLLTDCESCLPGYSYMNEKCIDISGDNCELQNQYGECARCVPGFFHYRQSNSHCSKCNSNCFTCSGLSQYDCTSCESPLILHSGLCWDPTSCHDSCATCEGPREWDCLTCNGATPLKNGWCFDDCHTSCLTCFGPREDQCQSCHAGITARGFKCITCTPGCATCYWKGKMVCLSCEPGYLLRINVCIPDSTICHPTCNICKGPDDDDCLNCQDGYTLFSGRCILCHSTCNKSCKGPTSSDCITYLSGHPYCINAISRNSDYPYKCLNCKPTYKLNGNTCYDELDPSTKCGTECLDCVGINKNQCLECGTSDPRIHLWAGNCMKKNTGCDKVIAYRCATCLPGFIPIMKQFIDGFDCVAPGFDRYDCLGNCFFCDPIVQYSTDGNCLQCKTGYSLSKGKCYLIPSNCLISFKTDKCAQCDNGYISIEGNCVAGCDQSCEPRRCSGGGASECTQCPLGGVQVRSTCWTSYNCDPTCKSCFGSGIDKCLSCEDDRTLLERQCVQCPTGCLICTDINDSNTCTSCKEGYSFKKDGASMTCIECHESCGDCWKPNDPKGCITCKNPGHHLYESGCLECDSSCPNGCFESNDPYSCYRCESPYVFLNLRSSSVYKSKCILCEADCESCYAEGPEKCLVCKPGFTLHSDRTCRSCHTSCRFCSGPNYNECTKCHKEQYHTSGGECLDCHPSCHLCSGIGEEDCITCKRGYSKVGNRCILCDSSCQECQGTSATDCTLCFASQTLNSLGQCFSCHSSCKTCKGILLIDCLTCNLGDSFVSSNSTCFSGCHTGYYLDSGTGACSLCSPNCKTCNGPLDSDCIICGDGYILDQGNCIIECQSYQYYDDITLTCNDCHSSCLTCINSSDPSNCKTCRLQYELFGSSCLLLCKDDEYRESSLGQCQKCHSLCTRCFGPSETHCTQCKIGITLIKNENHCKLECLTTQYTDNNQCKDCYPNCLTCSGPNNSDCLSCGQGSNLVSGQCICPTDNGKYIDLGNRECLDCHSRCLICSDHTFASCSACRPQFYKMDLSSSTNLDYFIPCLIECPDNYLPDNENMKCISCSPGCRECTGPSPNQCTSCSSGSYLFENSCFVKCPQTTYKDTKTNSCEPCPSNCLECSSKDTCSQCSPNLFLYQKGCLASCPPKYYPKTQNQNSICTQCKEGCIKCINDKICSECQDGLFPFSGKCITTCPEGSQTIIDQNQKKNCIQKSCSPDCQTCDLESTKCLECKPLTISGLPQILFQGECISCIKENGLKISVDNSCQEICGDGILYKLNNNFEESLYQDCDDDNTKNGDGCSSDCRIERAKTCSRQYQIIDKQNRKVIDQCVKKQDVRLIRNSNIFGGISYLLKFERNIESFKEFDSSYYVEYIKDNDGDILDNIEFISERSSPRILKINFIESQLEPYYDGRISIRRFKNATQFYDDIQGYRAIIEGVNTTFNFDYEQYLKVKNLASSILGVKEVTNNSIVKSVMIFLMLNPIVFDFVVNVLQKMVYFRLLDVMSPNNLDYFYKIFSDTTNINFGSLEGEIGEESSSGEGNKTIDDDSTNSGTQIEEKEEKKKKKISKIDKLLGITLMDQTPSQKFNELNFNTLSLKTSFIPFMIIIFIYTLGLVTQTLKIKNSRKFLNKETKQIVFILKRKSLFSDIYTSFYEYVVWNLLIRMMLLSTQMITLSIFLNLFQAPWFKNLGSSISFCFTISLILYVLGMITAMYFTMKRYQNSEGKIVEELKILHNVKSESFLHVHYKTYKYIVKTTLFSISACFLNRIPIIGCLILIFGDILQLGWLIWKRPYHSIFLNIKDIVESTCMVLIGILYMVIIIFQNDETMIEIFGALVLLIICFHLLLGILGKMISRKSIQVQFQLINYCFLI